MDVETIIKERLITHESVVGAQAPSIQNTTKRFFQFSESVQSSDTNNDVAYHKLLTEISRYEFDLQSGAVVQNTCTRELEQYSTTEADIESSISNTQRDINELKSTLQQERLRRQQKEEYETISRIINTHRPRDALQKEIAALETRLHSLNKDATDASNQVEIRQKQMHLFLNSMQELSSLWSELDDGSMAGLGLDTNGKSSPRSGLPMGSNDERDDDEEEEDRDNRRNRRGGEKETSSTNNQMEVDEEEEEDVEEEDEDVLMGESEMEENNGDGEEDGEIVE